MATRQSEADRAYRSPHSLGIGAIACLIAALFMLAGSALAAGHNHDDHKGEVDGECIVCASAGLGAAKISPEEPAVSSPQSLLIVIRFPDSPQLANRFANILKPARGPPLFAPSS